MTAPEKIAVSADRSTLTVCFQGVDYALSAELLRVESPSAEVRGHGVGQKRLIGGKKDVKITHITPVGRYAVRITFDDGHNTGLYTWDFLWDMARQRDEILATYIRQIDENGMARASGCCGGGCCA